jgi:hypothetical protein
MARAEGGVDVGDELSDDMGVRVLQLVTNDELVEIEVIPSAVGKYHDHFRDLPVDDQRVDVVARDEGHAVLVAVASVQDVEDRVALVAGVIGWREIDVVTPLLRAHGRAEHRLVEDPRLLRQGIGRGDDEAAKQTQLRQ